MRVNTNVNAMNAQVALRGSKKMLDQAMNRLSSGSRINKPYDDAAGLANSEIMKSSIRGLNQSVRNAQDGISLTQTAEGSLGEISNILIRMKELGIQSASDTVSDRERSIIDREYSQLQEEINRIAESTSFNGMSLLTGKGDKLDFQVNTKNSPLADRVSFDLADMNVGVVNLGLDLARVDDKISAQESLDLVERAAQQVNQTRASLASVQSRMNSSIESLQQNVENLSASNSRIRDADVAAESSEYAKQNVMMQTATAMLAQANNSNALALSLLRKD